MDMGKEEKLATKQRWSVTTPLSVHWRSIVLLCLAVTLMGVLLQLMPLLQRYAQQSSPFVIKDETIGLLRTKVLQNTDTGEYVQVIVDYGGRVEDLRLKSQSGGQLRTVLLTHNGNETAIIQNAGWMGMLLIPWANRIAYGRYTFFNGTYQLDVNENSTNPPLVNALHGMMAKTTLMVYAIEVTDDHALLTLSHTITDNIQKGYPFQVNILIHYELSVDGFSISFQISNPMQHSPLPLYVGWHPYFACTTYKAVLTFDQCTGWNHVQLNANMDPTGITDLYHGFNGSEPIGGNETNPTFYDDEFKPTKGPDACSVLKTKLYDTETDQTVVLWQDSNFRFVHVFTGSNSIFNENAVAIEPMSAMADAYNNHDHLTTLSAGETWGGSFGVYVE